MLTPTEFELLVLIALRRGDVVDHRTLLRAVWPGRPDADADLLRTHLTHLNAKLIGAGHPGLRNVRSTGYALRVAGAGRSARPGRNAGDADPSPERKAAATVPHPVLPASSLWLRRRRP